jgi:aminopeptidase N
MAHMWFGDLVTMKWWNDLWLNESFASWMATKAINHLFPEWNMWTQFIYTDYNSGLSLDGLENSHPIVQPVNNPSEINQLFDAISYSKGASIIRMLETFVGEEKFRDGLRKYMQLYKYANAEGNNLWECIQEASKTEIIPMMESWTKQTGYPVVNVKWESNSKLNLQQDRFLYSNKSNLPDTWLVPISIVSGSNMDNVDSFILSSKSTTIDAPKNSDKGYLKVNYDTAGFYRVNYPKEHWKNLAELITKQLLKPTDRLSIQSDAYALAKSRMISATVFLELIKSYNNEKDFGVWSDLATNMRSIDLLLRKTNLGEIYRNMCVETLKPIGQELGWEVHSNESHLESLLRTTILSSLGNFGDKETINKSVQLLEEYFSGKISLAPELRSIVYNLSAQTGDENIYNSILNRARKEQLQEEKLRLYASLCRVENNNLFNKTLELSISDEIRSQDTVSLLSLMSINRNNGAELTWDFIKSNWAFLDERYGSGGFAMMRLVGITGNLLTRSDYDDVEDFFQKHPIESALRTLKQSLERIDANISWLEYHIDEIESLLNSR